MSDLNPEQLNPQTQQRLNALFSSWDKYQEPFRIGADSTPGERKLSTRRELAELAKLLDISQPVAVISHRKVAGPLIVWSKKILMRLARPLIKICLGQQIALNERLFLAVHRLFDCEERIRTLEKEVAELKARVSS